VVPEVALVVVAMRKAIPKARQQVFELRWSNGDVFPHRDVDASTDQEIKRIVARGSASNGTTRDTASFVKIPVKITVRPAKHSFDKGFEMREAELYDRTHVVGEEIALSRYSTRSIAVGRRNRKVVRIATIALKLSLDTDMLAEEKCG
jgi:hypothetical protein